MNGLLRHSVDGLLEEAGHTQLELHQVAGEHHHVLHKGLKLHHIGLHVLQLLAAAVDALVYLLGKVLIHTVKSHSEATLLRGHLQRHLEGAQVWQCGQVGDMQVGSHDGLKVNADEGHKILHTAYPHLIIGLLTAEDLCK